ncbi:MAG: hypothetical protein C0459_10760 [Chitinophaga sp.]|nr:hypothetical protein [Chitinophaga sp.]
MIDLKSLVKKTFMKALLLFTIFLYTHSYCQTGNSQSLLDTVLKNQSGLFIHSKPIVITRLDKKEMWFYFENVRDFSNRKLDTLMFSEIIDNTKDSDTTNWRDDELKNSLLVNSREEDISKKYLIEKFRLNDKKQEKFYIKQIKGFNSTESVDRNLFYISRPVFDNSKTFAIIETDNGHSYLGGGGNITLYQLQGDNTWKEIGIILNWRY